MIFALGEMGEAKCNGETWMNLKNMLSDRRQTQKRVLCDSSFMNF